MSTNKKQNQSQSQKPATTADLDQLVQALTPAQLTELIRRREALDALKSVSELPKLFAKRDAAYTALSTINESLDNICQKLPEISDEDVPDDLVKEKAEDIAKHLATVMAENSVVVKTSTFSEGGTRSETGLVASKLGKDLANAVKEELAKQPNVKQFGAARSTGWVYVPAE